MKYIFKVLNVSSSPNAQTYLANNPDTPEDIAKLVRGFSMAAGGKQLTYVECEIGYFDGNGIYIKVGVITEEIEGYYEYYTAELKQLVWSVLYQKGLVGEPPADPDNDLEAAKQYKLREIDAYRDLMEVSGFNYLGKVFDSDSTSVFRIMGAVNAATSATLSNSSFTVIWTTKDNSQIELQVPDILGMSVALATHSNELHIKANQLKGLVRTANNLQEVSQVVWEST